MKVTAGYKQTEVGVIPADWETKRLGDALTICHGKSQKHIEDNAGAYPILATGGEIGRTDHYLCGKPSVLIGRKGTIDKPQYMDQPFWTVDTLFYSDIHDTYSAKFIYYVFCMIDWRSYNEASGVPSLNARTIEQISFDCPTLAEQQAIANALSDVDALVASLDALIAKKRDLKQAAMQQLLTGKTRLQGFSGKWETATIGEIATVGRGRVISHYEISKSRSPQYPVYSSQTSNNGTMGYIDNYEFEGNYITWTTDGANAGTIFARSGRFNCTNVCGTIKLHQGDHRYIASTLACVAKKHVSYHLGNPKLMNDIMKRIKIYFTSNEAEQLAIAEVLSDMDAELTELEQRRDKTIALKQGMMQELLTGRTRLV
jgi:type I restriction enzyme S subunit